ncbi:MAG: outer membrane beta-barrel protein [Bacteroidota bacterium]
MKNIKIFLVIACSAFCVTALHAQQGVTKISVAYSAGFPTGSFKDFISNTSFKGVDVRIMHGINDKISVGFGTGFQDFYQKYPRQVYKLSDGSDVSAVVSNTIEAVPILARFQYNFSPGKRIQPFAGIGAGGDLVLYSQYLGEFADSKNKFAFQAQPEVGIYIPFRPNGIAGVSVSGYYNVIPFKYNDIGNLNSFGFTVSIGFPMRN